jgi:hypothetical protein
LAARCSRVMSAPRVIRPKEAAAAAGSWVM